MKTELKLVLALVIAMVLAVSHWKAYDIGHDIGLSASIKAEDKRKDVVIGAVVGAVAKNDLEQKENGIKARKVSNGLQQEITGVLNYRPPVTSVRLPALAFACAGDVAATGQAPSASGPDGAAAGTVVFPEEVQRAFDRFTNGTQRLEGEADKVTAIARAHQEFARVNGFYGAPEGSK